ncbi:MAG: SagB/ThcOx family dehydrogenase [Thermodesulfobacteriota bacterium]|nr:SagB/ThcOx family dehydrogenase [Thermodesulfobacteriota bacterium]
MTVTSGEKIIELPEPVLKGKMPFEEALAARRSVRDFANVHLTEKEISQLLWSAQGITRPWGGRTAPSAGALYPIEMYIVLSEGLFRYVSRGHKLVRISDQKLFRPLAEAALGQECVRSAPAVIVITVVYERTEQKYGKRGERYVKMEVGHAAENILIQAVSLGLGAVPIGAFYDDRVSEVLNLPESHKPLYLIPVGWERE